MLRANRNYMKLWSYASFFVDSQFLKIDVQFSGYKPYRKEGIGVVDGSI